MKTPEEQREAVETIVPPMFEDISREYPLGTNLAGSNQRHVLSKGLYDALTQRQFDVRREYHEEGNTWHYLVAHTPKGSEPTEEDIITDLNPWQFKKEQLPLSYTFLHGPRGEIMSRLQDEGVPDYFIALRGIATVVRPHTTVLNDYAEYAKTVLD